MRAFPAGDKCFGLTLECGVRERGDEELLPGFGG